MIKEQFGDVVVHTHQETYSLAHVVPHRFFSTAEVRDLAIFESVGVPATETNLLRGFKFPFPLSLPIFYGPLLAAFISTEADDPLFASASGLQLDGMSLDEWSRIVEGWQDMALIRSGTQSETLRPYWTSDTAITEGAMSDPEGALDDVSDMDPEQPKSLESEGSSTEDDDGYSTDGDLDGLDIDDNEPEDELNVHDDEEGDPELLAYCRKTLVEDDE